MVRESVMQRGRRGFKMEKCFVSTDSHGVRFMEINP